MVPVASGLLVALGLLAFGRRRTFRFPLG
ncbi:MprA protease, GlyGly-CTERM protein-sorting domain-containing form [Bradyrhizobium jicamae]|uniref:MprA protease, GlyGly-CTERM protein-sorting domain-containing form n=1 Tax=Bradyrhizobium jicamae TaxID=280332 RepID=A0ABS5FT91_9BRAD|nr:MprA protease, GlyGly-CTERM protein-sorting domain-containing form [Bradyrhizobium jicamae]MBR0935801.1 MprA protease, GlyGly-CTERM protein-sorting domain-containing form [Bradyrhizobium jicamae]